MLRSKLIETDKKIIKLVRVGSTCRIVPLKGKILKRLGVDPDSELYGRWKIIEIDGKKQLVLEILPG